MQHKYRDPSAGAYDDFTLVIPTYNRPELLLRLLRYCVPWLPRIIVLDSSSSDIAAMNAVSISRLGGNISHKLYDAEINVNRKLYAGLAAVETEYFSFCADDDVVFPDGVAAALKYLKCSGDCVGVDGLYLNFDAVGLNVNVGMEYVGGGLEDADPIQRVFHLMQNYESRFYGIYRVSDALVVFRYLIQVKSLHFQELMQSAAILLIGKVHRVPLFFAARQNGKPADSMRENWQTYYWFAENPGDFFQHYKDYRSILLDFYCKYGSGQHIENESFVRAMDLAHAVFFSNNCPNDLFLQAVISLGSKGGAGSPAKDKLLQDLKSPVRRRVEAIITRAGEIIQSGFGGFLMPWHLKSLNQETKRRVNVAYRCLPPRRIGWLAGHPKFRSAYQELCEYLTV